MNEVNTHMFQQNVLFWSVSCIISVILINKPLKNKLTYFSMIETPFSDGLINIMLITGIRVTLGDDG